MQPLVISPEKAKVLYPKANDEFRSMLVDSFGEKFFKEKKPFQQILTPEDVFEAAGEDINDPQFYTGPADEVGYRLVKLLPKALNPADWVLNWDDPDQKKWGPWFYFNQPGFRFLGSYCTFTFSLSTGGSRARFASEEISDHAAKQFLPWWKQWLA